jgi:hypothetical protein
MPQACWRCCQLSHSLLLADEGQKQICSPSNVRGLQINAVGHRRPSVTEMPTITASRSRAVCSAQQHQQQHPQRLQQQSGSQSSPPPAAAGRRQLLLSAGCAAAALLAPTLPSSAAGIESVDLPDMPQLPSAVQKKTRQQKVLDDAEASFQQSGAGAGLHLGALSHPACREIPCSLRIQGQPAIRHYTQHCAVFGHFACLFLRRGSADLLKTLKERSDANRGERKRALQDK